MDRIASPIVSFPTRQHSADGGRIPSNDGYGISIMKEVKDKRLQESAAESYKNISMSSIVQTSSVYVLISARNNGL